MTMARLPEESRIDILISRIREQYDRMEPADLPACLARHDLIVDVRPSEQRDRDGILPHAVLIGRDVLEWRLDPTSRFALPCAAEAERVVIVCNEGYSSTLAVASLLTIGLRNVTDVAGGFQAIVVSGVLETLADIPA
jgi:rhodanese-related sulfurtransferase